MSEEEKPKVVEKGLKKKSTWGFVIVVIILIMAVLGFATGKIHVNPEKEVLPTNYAPEIKYAYETNLSSVKGDITIVVGVEDKDGDRMNIQFWIRESASAPWKGIGNFEGGNGSYPMKVSYMRNSSSIKGTCYWRVDVTDYKEFVSEEHEFKFTGREV
ncbi:MAG: hypothetical protein IMZ52_01610 [Actinobacteria bacterium]|nr:hypothetical protein [Actinomycetota bacterium]MBE3114821.1 hypothetical protein [Actinomycetota bacterium]